MEATLVFSGPHGGAGDVLDALWNAGYAAHDTYHHGLDDDGSESGYGGPRKDRGLGAVTRASRAKISPESYKRFRA
jgi:hypothetical protein